MFFLCGAICLAILLYHSIDQMPQPNGWYSFVRCLSRVRVRACVRHSPNLGACSFFRL